MPPIVMPILVGPLPFVQWVIKSPLFPFFFFWKTHSLPCLSLTHHFLGGEGGFTTHTHNTVHVHRFCVQRCAEVRNQLSQPTRRWHAKWLAQSERVRIACAFFARSAPTCMFGRCLLCKISVSELGQKFIKSALLVGW